MFLVPEPDVTLILIIFFRFVGIECTVHAKRVFIRLPYFISRETATTVESYSTVFVCSQCLNSKELTSRIKVSIDSTPEQNDLRQWKSVRGFTLKSLRNDDSISPIQSSTS